MAIKIALLRNKIAPTDGRKTRIAETIILLIIVMDGL